MMSTKKEVDFLLLGKTGNGKSATGNSILKKEVFAVSNSVKSATVGVDFEFSEYKDHSIAVTDSQGYGDTRFNSVEKVQNFCKCITMAMKANDGKGFHAFLVILQFGNRLTDEEKDVITAIKRLFKDVMSNHGILLMTGGDMFRKKTGIAFEDWTRQQGEDFDKLLTEFGGRIVLFDNETENEDERDAQIDRLLEMVKSLPSRGKRYSNIFFQAASAELAKSEAESEECDINRETLRSVSILLDKFDECNRLEDQENGADPKGQMEKWYSLLSRCDQLIDRIGNRGEREMTDVENKVVALRKTIQHFIKAKENESGEQVKRQAMLAAKDRLQGEYRKKKAVRVGLIVGGTLLGVGVVAAAIALVVLYPPSLAVMLRVARALYPLLKRALPLLIISLPSALDTVITAARQALSKRGNLPTDNLL